MKNLFAFILLVVMCVGHLNSKYLLVETEDDPPEDEMDRGGFSGEGQDFADPSPPPPTEYYADWWTRLVK